MGKAKLKVAQGGQGSGGGGKEEERFAYDVLFMQNRTSFPVEYVSKALTADQKWLVYTGKAGVFLGQVRVDEVVFIGAGSVPTVPKMEGGKPVMGQGGVPLMVPSHGHVEAYGYGHPPVGGA